jgi:hypothetical protein
MPKSTRVFFATQVDGIASIKIGKKKYINFPKLAIWAMTCFGFYIADVMIEAEWSKWLGIVYYPVFSIFCIYWIAVLCQEFVLPKPGDGVYTVYKQSDKDEEK